MIPDGKNINRRLTSDRRLFAIACRRRESLATSHCDELLGKPSDEEMLMFRLDRSFYKDYNNPSIALLLSYH